MSGPETHCPNCQQRLTSRGGHRGFEQERACFERLADLLRKANHETACEVAANARIRDSLAARNAGADHDKRRGAFAAAALTGLLSAPAETFSVGDVGDPERAIALLAWDFADRMLEQEHVRAATRDLAPARDRPALALPPCASCGGELDDPLRRRRADPTVERHHVLCVACARVELAESLRPTTTT